MFIDTHAHIYEQDFKDDINEVIGRAKEAGAAKVLLPPTNEASTLQALALSKQYPGFCYPMVGLHPEDIKEDWHEELDRLETLLKDDVETGRHRFVAVGEVGLDYYWDKSHKEEQKETFSIQIDWASKYRLPLMIHARSANGDLMACMSPWRNKLDRGGVFHCFSGSVEMACELMRFQPNFYLGIGGVLTFKKSNLPEVVKSIPLERIVLETDSPYMAPVPMRGKRNEPSFVPYVISLLAQAKGVSVEEVETVTTQNAMRLFFSSEI